MTATRFPKSLRTILGACALGGAWFASIYPGPARAQAQPDNSDLGEVGNKLANPLSDLWALSFSANAPQFFDGDLNTGDPEVGGVLLFQPVMPFPLYGEGEDQWRLITRPIIPIGVSTQIAAGLDDFDHTRGSGDIRLQLIT